MSLGEAMAHGLGLALAGAAHCAGMCGVFAMRAAAARAGGAGLCRLIVYTIGKYENSERHYKSERPPLFPVDKPLVILVDEGTASASEIVSGAIQDWDRGLIIGAPTYGKGLVQQIFPISNDGELALKLTTAKYYVPSGRCIQKAEKQGKTKPGSHPTVADNDSLAADSLTVDKREVFYTNAGREVYGGGGIIPDIEIDRPIWKPIEINLYRKSLFFDYAVKYVSEHPDVKPIFTVSDEIVADFRAFTKEKEFDYTTSLQVALNDLKEKITDAEKDDMFAEAIAEMETLIEKEKEQDFDESDDYIRRTIKREIVASIAGERGVYEEVLLKTDKTVMKAVEILQTPGDYTSLITTGQKKADVN